MKRSVKIGTLLASLALSATNALALDQTCVLEPRDLQNQSYYCSFSKGNFSTAKLKIIPSLQNEVTQTCYGGAPGYTTGENHAAVKYTAKTPIGDRLIAAAAATADSTFAILPDGSAQASSSDLGRKQVTLPQPLADQFRGQGTITVRVDTTVLSANTSAGCSGALSNHGTMGGALILSLD